MAIAKSPLALPPAPTPPRQVFYPLAAMADAKRDRQRLARQAKIEAELAAKKRAAAQRRAILFGAGFVVLAAIVLIVNRDDGSDTTVATDSSSTTLAPVTTPAVESAAGKPCVARSQPLPEGAPEVDVAVGPPPSALVTQDITVGPGAPVPPKATVTVNYIGISCSTGVIFDASYGRGEPVTFALDQVIPGWQQGIPGMNVGGKRLLGIPPDLAYQDQGRPPSIAPDETLWFVVEVLDAKPPA
jgi:peptidylprolyl isomerase